MRHRHLSSNSFTRFGVDQHETNHTPVDHSYFPPATPENSPFVGQMNHHHHHHHHHHMSRVGGVQQHSGPPRMNMEGGSRSNTPMEVVVQPFVPPFPHPPITENSSLPAGGHGHYTNYNVPNTHELEAGGPHHHHHPTGKRKRSGSLNNLYSAGSSSSSSSQMPMEKQTMVPPYRGGSLTIDGQDSSRNVRRRYSHNHRHDDDMESTTTHLPNHNFYQSTPSHPPNYPAPVPHYPIRLAPPDISGSRHELTQFHGGGSSGDSVFSRHSPSSQNLHGAHGHHANHSRRIQSSYGNGSRYSHYAHGGTSSTNGGMRAPPESFSSRNSRHCSPGGGWRGNYRSGRPRLAVDRFHSVVDVTESHDRIGHETMMMVDRASFYGNSRNFSDQYRDLRLDIDNMSYEELLNLEERIGSVNTGLSEDNMSKYLREKVYCSSDQSHEEGSCPICLEEYKNGDNIGMMEKCGHDYHVDCIKKWLLMKKLCPICKTECSNQESREG